ESEKDTTPQCPGCGKLMVVEKFRPIPKGKDGKYESTKPSAPLLPLHLRAPMKTQIKQGAKVFYCVCGEHILIRTGTEGQPIQCPNCSRFHRLQIDATPSPVQAPKPPAKEEPVARPEAAPPAPSRPLGMGEFLCKCGAIQPP